MYKRLFQVDPWTIKETSLHKEDMRLSESITSLGNEFMGMRGNFEETYSGDSHQGTYVGGVWFPDKTRVGWWKNGYPEYFGKAINSPSIIDISVLIDGEPVDLYLDKVLSFERSLNMRNGTLERSYIIEKNGRRYQGQITRFLSIGKRNLCMIRYSITPLDGPGLITFVPGLEGDVHNEDSNYQETFWENLAKSHQGANANLTSRTKSNPFGVEQFTLCSQMNIKIEGEQIQQVPVQRAAYVGTEITLQGEKNQPCILEKYVATVTSRDMDQNQLEGEAIKMAEEAENLGFDWLLQEHSHLWQKRWDMADVIIEGDEEAQQGIRFNLFQLFCTYYGADARVNIGPKGFTGEKYGGATYWDTEAYAIPLYLAVAPETVTQNLLKYRYDQIEGAFINAKRQGLPGALYPMVTFNGLECHNEWEITFEEIHRNGAIAYAIYNHANYTGDRSYVEGKGLRVLIEISRFWAGRVHFAKSKNMYMIHGVTGPNEYENNVNNNWYTNTLARWTLDFTLETIQNVHVSTNEYYKASGVTEKELDKWADIRDNIYLPFNEERGIFLQQDTFLDKDIKRVDQLTPEDLPLNQKWSWDRILRSCFIKQADVLQGIYFFGDQYSIEEKKRNFDFYEPMTVHESSLSPSIHSILAAELGYEEKAVEMYQRTARLDLDNYNNDTEDGLHITSMTGSWLGIVQGFGGMRTTSNKLSFYPMIPKGWNSYSFHIMYRKRKILIQVWRDKANLTLIEGEPLEVSLWGQSKLLSHKIEAASKTIGG